MDLNEVRRRLEAEFRDVTSQHDRISAHLRNQDREVPIDWPDMAQFMGNDEVLESLEEHTRQHIEAIMQAVRRLDDGTYATCGSCGSTITDERLELLPTTPICSDCA